MKRFIKLFWIIFIIPLFVANTTSSQNTHKGSWIISSRYVYFEIFDHKTYQLDFSSLGDVQLTSVGSGVIDGDYDSPLYSLGAFDASGDLDFYILGEYYQYDGNISTWGHPQSNFGGKNPDIQIIRNLDEQDKYLLFYSYNSLDKDPYETKFAVVDITVSDDEVEFVERDVDYLIPPNSYDFDETDVAFIISNYNLEDNSRYLFASTTAPSNDPDDYFGLMKLEIDDNNDIEIVDYLLASNDSEVFSWSDFRAYNLEMQNKNEVEDPIIAWIKKPIPGENSKIFIYLPDDDEYFIEMNEGAIGGIEFSPFDGEENIMYVSTENSGLVKLDYINQEYTVLSGGNEFKNTYVQTAPDGNVYAVSADGTHLGRVDKEDGLLHNHIIDYDDTYIHGTFYEIEDIRYFTLPENDQPVMKVEVQTSNILCDQNTAIASIYVHGGIPPYGIEVKRGTTNVSGQFTWDDEYGCFRGTQLIAGTYKYTITDSGTTGELGITGEFEIVEGDAYDFEDNLLEINNQTAANINGLSDLVWDENDVSPQKGFLLDNTIMFKHGIRLNGNTTLTINNLQLEFDEDYLAKVIIEPGSKLILNNCILTNYHCSDPSAKWAGVEVWGNKNAPQTEANQGKLVMNNSTIEHAHEAVQLWNPDRENPDALNTSGGIIYATNSTFKNNRRAVSFMSYKNEPFGLERNYDAYFNFCDFINDGEYIDDNPFHVFVSMWGVRGVQFKACDFINSTQFPASKAIYTLDAGYKLKGYCNGYTGPNGCVGDWIPNTFTNFEKAIESANLPSDPDQYSINIWDSDFENNQWGVYMTTVNNAVTMLYNKFQLGNSGNNFEKTSCGYFSTRGIQMNESFGFNIEENEFDKMEGNIDTDLVGVLVNKCKTPADDIYLNTFKNLTAANQAEKDNRLNGLPDDSRGITYSCNTNEENIHDFYITADSSMIRGEVGSLYLASGNKLSNTAVIFRNDYTQYVNYYYWTGDPDQILPDIDPNDYVIPIPINYQNECLSNYGNNGGGIGIDPKVILSAQEKQEVELEFYSNYQAYEAVNDLLTELKDGGSTEITNLSIAAAQPGDTWELRSNLLNMSPYLSKTVLMEAADRTDILPESVLFEILSANPEELRKQDLMQHLENKDQPMPDYMLAILRQMSNGSSAKTALLSQKALHFAGKTKAAQKMILSIKNEEELDIVALRNWLGNLESMEADKQVVATYLYEEDYANANALLDLIPELYNLEGNKLQEFNDYVDLLNLQMGLKQQNRNIFMLTEAEKSQLLDFAENSTGDARNGARSILSFVYGNDYCDCITSIEGGNKSSHTSYVYSNEDIAKALGFSINIKPNPATVHTSVDYTLPIGIEQSELQLINTEGKIIWTKKVSGIQGQITIDIRSYKSGAYIFRLLSEEYSISESLIIN